MRMRQVGAFQAVMLRLGVIVKPFRPTLKVAFALLEPEIGPSPPVIAEFRAAVKAAAGRQVAAALVMAEAP